MPDTRRGGRVIDLDEAVGGTEVMAEQLEGIAEGVRRLLHGRLTEQAVIILIREMLPHGMKLGPKQIKAVLDAAKNLNRYVRTP